ncbi:MAG TPA: molybdopterin oxidoreductase [Opitutae bacterium]|nr:molybdopterin oxidoreductase [Opitutae bacterium]
MLLKEQGTLQTPVGVFSAQHETVAAEPEQAQFYKQLIPLSKPSVGEQYAFKVDLDRCTGCKGCVSACHSLNGLDDHETWRDVGVIHGGGLAEASFTQTVTTACHHCADPACLNGCPVLAYEKDPETGIVRHLDDQCIGCQYCALKCPYDVPKYSKQLGIVRKCDMCHDRLAEGEAPACVQACPTEAISITIVNTHEVTVAAKGGVDFLPTAPAAEYTVPTTQYVTTREIPKDVVAGDLYSLKTEHAHLPLVLMLVLTQLSVGLYAAALYTGEGLLSVVTRVAAFISMGLGLAASTSHLGRPLGAWRAFLGLRRSWLSREIVIFGAFSGVAFGYTASAFIEVVPAGLEDLLAWSTVLSGALGVFCSVMIYHDTRRPFWRFSISGFKFFATTVGLGIAGYLTASVYAGLETMTLLYPLLATFIFKLVLEVAQLGDATAGDMSPSKKSAMLMLYPLRTVLVARFVLCAIGLLSFGFLFVEPSNFALVVVGFSSLLASELLERVLFFKAVAAPKMPGGVIS